MNRTSQPKLRLFSGPLIGPQPILFARDPEVAKESIRSRPAAIRRGLTKFLQRFQEGEAIHLDEAAEVVAQPREAQAARPFGARTSQEERPVPVPVKRPGSGGRRPEAAEVDEDGPRHGEVSAPVKRIKTSHTGTKVPRDSRRERKYGLSVVPKAVLDELGATASVYPALGVEPLRREFLHAIDCSLAKTTWARYQTALKTWETVQKVFGAGKRQLYISRLCLLVSRGKGTERVHGQCLC